MAGFWEDILGPSHPRTVSVTRQGMPSSDPGTMQQSGGGAAQPFDLASLLKKLQGSYDASNASGLEQYKNLMGTVNGVSSRVLGAGGLYDQAGANLSGMGQTARSRIAEDSTKAKAASSQDLIGRGLGNTTVVDSMNRGINSDAERANQGVDEQVNTARSNLLMSRAGAEGDLGRLTADSILSKHNEGPDQAMYANLIAQLGRSGGLGSFPSGGGSSGTVPMTGGSRGGTTGGVPGPITTGAGSGYDGQGGVQTFRGTGNGDQLAHVADPNTLEYWKGWQSPSAKLFEYRQQNGLSTR